MNKFIATLLIGMSVSISAGVHASPVTGQQLMKMGMQAYREAKYDLAIENLKRAYYEKNVAEALVTLAYINMFDKPGMPADPKEAAWMIREAVNKENFKGVVYTAYFYQRVRTPEAAYLTGLAYYLSKHKDLAHESMPVWEYWFKRSVNEGYVNPTPYQQLTEFIAAT